MGIAGAARAFVLALAAATAVCAQITLSGRIVDEHEAPVAAARVSARIDQQTPVAASTGPTGTFQMTLPAPGTYLFTVERLGYYTLQSRAIEIRAGGAEVTLVLSPQREVFQSVNVGESPSWVDPAQTSREQHLSGTEVNDVPYPASHSLRNGMRIIPGVIQDQSGGLHFHGGAEYQTQYTLDGFDISDPIDGRFTTRLAVEGVRSLDLRSARQSPQYGRGSAGTMEINTENGTDNFHYTATNFIPGLDTHGGGLHLGDWTPRALISGPIKKGRAWFSDSFNGEYNQGYISGLPKGADTNTFWTAGNLFRTQVNLTAANILYADFLGVTDHAGHAGLGVLDPLSTTRTATSTEWLAGVKDTQSWMGGSLLEFGFAWQRVHRSSVPMGTGLYVLSTTGRQGNYFVNSDEVGRRDQLFVNFFPPSFEGAGHHQIQIGADYQHLGYTADFRRSGYQVLGFSGLPLYATTFRGSGTFALPNNTFAAYANDRWQPFGKLTIDAGIRQYWDELVGNSSIVPRVAAAYAPFTNGRTKFTGGYAMLQDATNLALFSRPLDQEAVTVPYSAAGVPGVPFTANFVNGHGLEVPRYSQWSAGADHNFARSFDARIEWLRKRTSNGFVYANETGGAPVILQPQVLGYGFEGTYALTNLRKDVYDEVSFTVRQSLPNQYGWLASYTRSRALSNAVLDVNVDQPIQLLNSLNPMPWDAPNRFLGWGYLPLPLLVKDLAIAFLADYRTGFPFSIVDETQHVTGPFNSLRFPSNFDLNLHLEKRFTFHGYRLGIRAGFNNITDHRNPTAVNNVMGSPQFLQFFGDEGRHGVLRIRFFGRAKT